MIEIVMIEMDWILGRKRRMRVWTTICHRIVLRMGSEILGETTSTRVDVRDFLLYLTSRTLTIIPASKNDPELVRLLTEYHKVHTNRKTVSKLLLAKHNIVYS